jgi:dTDP-4-dehydrorhamnose 3,5-epimerase
LKILDTEISDVKIIEPRVFEDERGFFFESFNLKQFREATGLVAVDFVQDNHSRSQRGVLRGIHYQKRPFGQGKLVRVVRGEVFDVVVDLRPESKTYGRHVAVMLSETNKRQLWIPEGLGHAFLTISDEAEFLYKTTNYYSPAHEVSIAWDDHDLAIKWPSIDKPISLAAKDSEGIPFKSATLD